MTHGTTDLTADVPLDEIRALVEERGRYEGWLDTLESRRSGTPDHVYQRVREDYGSRLQRVLLTLAGHVGPLRGAETALTRRREELTSQLAERRDELAEAELRTMVGEYSPEEGDRLRREKEEDIARMDESLRAVGEELAQVQGLLGRSQSEQTASSDDGAGEVRTDEATPAAEAPQAAPAPDMPMHPPGMMRPTPSIAAFAIDESADPRLGGLPTPTPAPQPGRATPAGGSAFDDLSILGGLSGRQGSGQSATPARGTDAPSIRSAFDTPASTSPSEASRPFAPQAGELASPAAKTLRCQECGTMNYPTEWYCERCGGELAAL